jgi:Mg-chelatase subunit ChlD
LRRKPKQLDAEPSLFTTSASGQGLVLQSPASRGGSRAAQRDTPAGTVVSTTTDDAGALVALPPEPSSVDPEVRATAARIAARLSLRRPRADATQRRGAGTLTSVPYKGGSDDVDLDRTLEVLAERPVPDPEDIVVRERMRTRRSVVLLVDVSGSMRGERIRSAAATVGALAGELARDHLGVVAFWSDAAVLLPLGRPVLPQRLVEDLLRLPARGLTNIAFPLQVARRELAAVPVRDARVLLLSDCVHNAGPDPRPAAARLPRLDVLLDVTGEHDLELGRDLAAAGRGRLRTVRTHRDVAPALTAVFRP